ncbi:hypothetical protein CCYA_CCYA18G4618 [Cyanidiococcus yangmingshanensis]|nr:hypothetical protein CCYA_CCYA18G4618 [Cyanidiococcus yangmingshanensis]
MSGQRLAQLARRFLGRVAGGSLPARQRCLGTVAGPATSEREQSVEVAQNLTGIAGRYAGSLLRVATKANKLSEVRRDVSALEQLLRENPRVESFLGDPTRSQVSKSKALKRLMDAAGVTTSYVRNLLQVLADNRRLNYATQVLGTFQSVISAQQGSTQAVVTSAAPLSEWQLALLRQRLQHRFFPDMSDVRIEIVTQLDKDLIGGFTVQFEDKFLDLSLRTEVRRIRDELAQQV